MIFQEPMSSLNPCFTVGFQIEEVLRSHLNLEQDRTLMRAPSSSCRQVGIPAPEARLRAFPHQMSGGMSQRVMIAMAHRLLPKLLIADEPTTALDVTIQEQILDLLMRLQTETGMGLVLITHSMGVVAETADRVSVQYAGQKVEEQPVEGLFSLPRHPYTAALLSALPERAQGRVLPSIPGVVPGQFDRPAGCLFSPRCNKADDRCRTIPPPYNDGALCHYPLERRMNLVISAQNLKQHYQVPRGALREPATLKAVDGASFTLARGKTLAVVGESGCGKSTLARMVTMIEPPTAGTLELDGQQIVGASRAVLRALRSRVQIVFQNPYGSLNPRQKIGSILEEPLIINTGLSHAERVEKVRAIMEAVGLRPEHYGRYPHMFSGGQRQRIAIARALILEPELLVLDEPVSALDISIQAQVLNLLAELQVKRNLAYLFISHDLAVVRHIADEVMVMYLGRVVEQGPAANIFANPQHPYTQALLSATPMAIPARKRQRIVLQGELPSPLAPPPGCTFHPRCPIAFDRCRVEDPAPRIKNGIEVCCHAVAPD